MSTSTSAAPPCTLWDPDLLERHPAFAPLRGPAGRLGQGAWPSPQALEGLLRDASAAVVGGLPVRLVGASAERYEQRLFATGELAHRDGHWHDLFNALAWACFPRAKAQLNAAHVMAWDASGGQRGPRRDALTLFDESGLVVACPRPELLGLVQSFRWKDLFWDRRAEVCRSLRVFVFGHALYEKLLAPYPSITGHALLLEVDECFADRPLGEQLAMVDAAVAHRLAQGWPVSPRELSPLPVQGIPGWAPENETASFYDDARIFRSGRRR